MNQKIDSVLSLHHVLKPLFQALSEDMVGVLPDGGIFWIDALGSSKTAPETIYCQPGNGVGNVDEWDDSAFDHQLCEMVDAWLKNPVFVARNKPSVIKILTEGPLDELNVIGADIPTEQLEMLVVSYVEIEVVNQDGVHLKLSFDMDGQSLVAVPVVSDLGRVPVVVPPMPNVRVRADGNANFYHLLDGNDWVAAIQLNGEFLTSRQEAMMQMFADVLRTGSVQEEVSDVDDLVGQHAEVSGSAFESVGVSGKVVEMAPLANNQYLHESIRRLQNGLDCYTEEAPEYAEISAALSALQSLIAPVTPRIVIGLEGGIIQGATANVPIEYLVYDYDIEGADADEIAVRPALDGGEVEVFDSGVRIPEIDAAIVDKVFAAANRGEWKNG